MPEISPLQERSFNRTIIELKLPESLETSLCFLSFNRTIIELKHARGRLDEITQLRLLIGLS